MPNRVGLQRIAIQDIWLIREGDDVVVYVQREGQWYEAIREQASANFSHCITANGLASAQCQSVSWLNRANEA
jgi:hypothetical protein